MDTTAAKFWPAVGKKMNGKVDGFIGKPKNIEALVAETVGPNDPPEIKLQKLYARVQQIRNTSYEVEKTAEEQAREKEKASTSAEGVWKKGYGSGANLTWLYLGLVRAAGFDAYGVLVPSREDFFFDPTVFEERRLNEGIVLVKLNGKNIFCDPGTLYTPFGLLPSGRRRASRVCNSIGKLPPGFRAGAHFRPGADAAPCQPNLDRGR